MNVFNILPPPALLSDEEPMAAGGRRIYELNIPDSGEAITIYRRPRCCRMRNRWPRAAGWLAANTTRRRN
jgi:hypothetical protein